MPYHVSTLLGSDIVHAEAYLTKPEAEQQAERKALELAADNLRLQEEHVARLERAVLDLDDDDLEIPPFSPIRSNYTYRIDRCANSQSCTACLEAGFDQAEKWPRRGSSWGVFDRGTHIEILREVGAQTFENDEQAASFVVMTAQNPGTPEAVRDECQLALREIIIFISQGIEAWREIYGEPGRWQEILGCEDEEDTPCECLGSGFLVMNEERYEPEEALGEIQACDCGIFKTDDDAIEAARAAGYTVTDEGLITSEPCRQRALRRWRA
jgi:hypothetical protein